MMFRKSIDASRALFWRGALATALMILTAGCAQLGGIFAPTAPFVSGEWAELLKEVRVYERRIGFADTDNFADLTQDYEAFVFCGVASRLVLPYSYQDPAITWRESQTEEECREHGRNADVYYGAVEAWGEVGTPVTPAMITSKLDRFLYLVIHEDCHDQFKLPYGIEEALCDLITFKGMAEFTRARFGAFSIEHRSILRYADAQSRIARATVATYTRLETLYGRHARRELTAEALLQERAAIYKAAEKPLAWTQGELTNVALANHMTYSRHYPFLESVFDVLGRDLPHTIAFFRHVDKTKPEPETVMKQNRLKKGSVEFVRAYEVAVMETIRKALIGHIDAGTAAVK
ncbi:MAG: aminopeptidase [Burkholderiales bacterium]|nr:aminopeptidase [Burkholderiales bacterium]